MSRGIGETQRVILTHLRTHLKSQLDEHCHPHNGLDNDKCHAFWLSTDEIADTIQRSPRQVLRAMKSLEDRGLIESERLAVGWIGAGEMGREDYKGEKIGMPRSAKCYRAILPHGESLSEYDAPAINFSPTGETGLEKGRNEHVNQLFREYRKAERERRRHPWPAPEVTDEWANEYAPRR